MCVCVCHVGLHVPASRWVIEWKMRLIWLFWASISARWSATCRIMKKECKIKSVIEIFHKCFKAQIYHECSIWTTLNTMLNLQFLGCTVNKRWEEPLKDNRNQWSVLSKHTPAHPVCVSPSVLLNSTRESCLAASAPPPGCPSGARSPGHRQTDKQADRQVTIWSARCLNGESVPMAGREEHESRSYGKFSPPCLCFPVSANYSNLI